MHTTVLSQQDIRSIVASVGIDELMDELIAAMEVAFRQFDARQTNVPVRAGFNYKVPRQGLLEWMPLFDSGQHVLMKMVGYHPQNPDLSQLPTILSDYSLYCAATGRLEAVFDGTLLTALRTGAASAVASKVLAIPNSQTIGLIGCGAQAVTQLHALTRCFDVEDVLFFDVAREACDTLEHRCASFASGLRFDENSVKAIMAQADIVSIATSIGVGAGPVFPDQSTQSHLHINAVGSDFPNKFELPKALLERSFITPDSRAQADSEGECQQVVADQIGDEFYQLLQNWTKHDLLQQQVTVFDSTGWVVEDYVVAKQFLRHANRLGIGSRIAVGTLPADPKNPYEFLGSDATRRIELPDSDSAASRIAASIPGKEGAL